MGLDRQAGAEPENRAGVLRNVRLEQGYAHGGSDAVFQTIILRKSYTA
jgi:hypothetical protein